MSDLHRLAELVGIEPYYWDIFGNRRETSDATMLALLSAVGLAVDTPEETTETLREEEERPWRDLLGPAPVVLEGRPIELPLAVADGVAVVSWEVTEEDGSVRHGEVRVKETREIDSRVIAGVVRRRRSLVLPPFPLGYHTLTVRAGREAASTRLIVAPERCVTVEDVIPEGRTWGVGLQLYSLRSESDWGIGDFDDLGRFAEEAAELGSDLVGLNPLHQLFPSEPNLRSPYSPSSRRALNIQYIDIEAVPEWGAGAAASASVTAAEFVEKLEAARASELVDHEAVVELKLQALAAAHKVFRARRASSPKDPRAIAFADFIHADGGTLRRFAIFEALVETLSVEDPECLCWWNWPEDYSDPNSPAVAAFAKRNEERVEFFLWCQFEADRQLGLAAARAKRSGLRLGFYRDLAVAVNPAGAETWADRTALVAGVNVGSPPDAFNLMGQNWGLSPLSPLGLRRTGYTAFIEAMRANMRHAGAMRIDHVMALKHLFWLPAGGEPGAYVQYPFEDMLRIVALESRRAGCVIIGEDLGTVPEGFRPIVAERGVLSYRVLYFERGQDGSFLPPEAYPAQALATVSTHDLATFRGFWNGRDLEWRRELNLYPDQGAVDHDKWNRGVERWRLLQALNGQGLRPWRYPDDEGSQPWSRDLAEAVHRYLARTPSRVVMLQIEDALSEFEQPNLPGTVDQHPNWRRRLPVKVETISSDEGVRALARAVGEGRTRRT